MGNPLKSRVSPAIFWGFMIFLATIPMLYLYLQGHFANNETAKSVATAMILMTLSGIVLSAGKVFFTEKHFLASAQAFLIGFVSWGSIASFGGEEASILVMKPWTVFSTVGLENLPGQEVANTGLKFWEWYVPNVINPISEEILWGVGLPVFLVMMMDGIAKEGAKGIRNPWVSQILRSFQNPLAQLVVLVTVLPITFAAFHVGMQASMLFLVSAITFRGILTVLWFGDLQWEIVPFLLIVPAFLVGSHMGNNWGATGIQKSLTVATSHPVGWMTLGILGFISFIAILGLIEDAEWLRAMMK